MHQYLELLQDVIDNGKRHNDRTNVGVLSVFGRQVRFDLTAGFPLLTTKKMHQHSIITELLWFLKGDTNTNYLHQHNVRIWDEWANQDGELGPIYGHQWRAWQKKDGKPIDQISQLIQNIRNNPNSRRHIVAAWNVADLPNMTLPPCHCLFQFYVDGNSLSCQLYQRSADIFLGVPFNIASYALLTQMIAQVCNLQVGEFIHSFGDLHLYNNHAQQAQLQLSRAPYPLPQMRLNPARKDIFAFTHKDFELLNYQFHPRIQASIAV